MLEANKEENKGSPMAVDHNKQDIPMGDGNNDEECALGLSVCARLVPELKTAAAAASDDQLEKLTFYKQKARNRVSANITFVTEDTLDTKMVNIFKESAVGKLRRSEGTKLCGIFYDYKIASQSSASPHLRAAGLRSNGDHLKKYIGNALAGYDATCIGPKDLYFLFDGKREGNKLSLHAGFAGPNGQKVAHTSKCIYLTFSEESLNDRLDKVRGLIPIEQVERMYVCGVRAFDELEEVKRKHYPGSNRGNFIGPIKAPDWDDEREMWLLSHTEKKNVLGKNGIHQSGGGAIPGVAAEKYKFKSKSGSNLEPVFFHERLNIFNDEILHSYNMGGVIDLTAAGGSLAAACLMRDPPVPYVGVTLSAAHSAGLHDRLESVVFKAMQDSKCTGLYEPLLAELISTCNKGDEAGDPDVGSTEDGPKKGIRKKPKGAGKPKSDSEDLIAKLKELQAKTGGKNASETKDVIVSEIADEDVGEEASS